MRLRRIEIENFKGIGKRQAIDLKPITLLFGPNSAGKSTILQALHYMRELLERQNPDPDQTIAGGLIDLGGFRTLVHNHELKRAITIKLVIDLSEDMGNDRLPLNSGTHLNYTEFTNLDILYLAGDSDSNKHAVVRELGVMVEVRWSALLMGPFVSLLSLDMNGTQILAIKSPPQKGRAIITDFNFEHPLLQHTIYQDKYWDNYWDFSDYVEDDELLPKAGSFASPLDAEIWELSRDMAKRITTIGEDNLRVTVSTPIGALPNPNKPLELELRDPKVDKPELEQSTSRVKELGMLLDELVLGPVRVANDYLSRMTYIGPLREVPTRNFRPRVSPDESRWARGLAAWDLLYSDVKGDLVLAVNQWLDDPARLNTGYQLERTIFRKIAVPSRLNSLFEGGLTEQYLAELQDLYENLETHVEVALRDSEKGILVAPDDIGVGISQMLPVVVGCLVSGVSLLAVEQPELHVHPALQVAMGDLLICSAFGDKTGFLSGKSLLVETHSEHIMLRLLRRIRETSEGELPPGIPPLTPDAVSVVYVEAGEDGVKFYSLKVDGEGEFVDRWPRGFFDERAEELF